MSPKVMSVPVLAALVLGCAGTVPFLDAPAQPAALAEAKVSADDNGNAQVKLWVEHLAFPAKLTPPKQTYVLWAETTFGRTLLLGKLKVDKDLEARWQGSVPFERFRLIISAEDVTTPERPSSPFVMTTDYLEPGKSWL